LIRCFEHQDYEDCELVILDDAGQYENTRGDRWRLISLQSRFRSLGEKRNAAVGFVSPGVEALAVWDDDDLYLPWALRASVAALRIAAWSRPSLVLHPQPGGALRQHRTGGLFHGGWAYRRDAFEQCGGYPAINNGEDQALAARLLAARTAHVDPIKLGFRPFYIYTWGNGQHLSGLGPDGYERLARRPVAKAPVVPCDPPTVDLRNPQILPGVHARVF
jgi:hypothetical protein